MAMMTLREGRREVALSFDKRLYAREAVISAAKVFSDRAEFFMEQESEERLDLALQARKPTDGRGLQQLAGEFANEALNQDLRLDLVMKNSRIVQLLTAFTLHAASGPAEGTPQKGSSQADPKKAP